MTTITAHPPGTFCWFELATTDQAAAVRFYCQLFGWEVSELPMGPGETYSMLRLGGRDVAAAYTLQAAQREQGVPPNWGVYISVANADDTTAKAQSLGATVLAPSFDVMQFGRMAVLQDPTGAVFSVWQPKQHVGVTAMREPGAVCWTELATGDTARAQAFYTALFHWEAKTDPGGYTEFRPAGGGASEGFAGMLALNPAWGPMPSHWMTYFQVEDCDAALARATALGGKTLMAPMDIPHVGRFAVLGDPQGAAFAVFTPRR